jgi:tetratricopeptide (TPR) repeat protein
LPEIVDKYEELTQREHPSWLISAYLGMQDLQALEKFRVGFLALTDDPEFSLKGQFWILLGRYRQLAGEFELAEQAYNHSLQIFEAEGSRLELGRAYAWRAELYTHIGRNELAQADRETARRLFEQCGAKLDLKRIRD